MSRIALLLPCFLAIGCVRQEASLAPIGPLTAARDACAELDTDRIEFGEVRSDGSAAEGFVTVRSVCEGDLEILDLQLGEASPFSVESVGAIQLAEGSSTDLVFRFLPADTGVFVAQATLLTSDWSEPELSITLTGTGVAKPAGD